MNEPLLSICIPTYNNADAIYKSIKKYLEIPCTWIEIVVTDDCSSDQTRQLLSSIADTRFKLITNERNMGYENLAYCLKNGAGKFCLLLSDVDMISSQNWDNIKDKLENDETTAIFQFQFENEEGKQLYILSDRTLIANTYEAYDQVLRSCAWSGGFAVRREVLDLFWNCMVRKPLLWRLYSQMCIALYATKHGDISHLRGIKVVRMNRSYDDSSKAYAWCGGMDEPYWTIKSRTEQNIEWIQFFSDFEVDIDTQVQLAERTVCEAIRSVGAYCEIINYYGEKPFFKQFTILMDRDRELYKKKWLRKAKEIYFQVNEEFVKSFKKYNKIVYLVKIIDAFKSLYWYLLKETIKRKSLI